jgi:manganese-dependent inorganic pyrophosphatase
MPMFEAKSDLWGMPILDVIQYDYKVFELSGKNIGIGSLETTNPAYGLWRKSEILDGFSILKADQDLDFIMLCVVDILSEKNTTIIWNEDAHALEAMFNVQVQDNLADLWNRISRKKQLAPVATEYFKSP